MMMKYLYRVPSIKKQTISIRSEKDNPTVVFIIA